MLLEPLINSKWRLEKSPVFFLFCVLAHCTCGTSAGVGVSAEADEGAGAGAGANFPLPALSVAGFFNAE